MKLILTSVVAIIFVALGSFAGVMLKTPSSAAAAGDEKAAKEEAGDEKKDDHGKKEKPDAKKGDKYASSGSSDYFKFSREFVVPVMRNDQVKSLVILHITLETDSSTADDLFSEEPKLRDNIMTTLIGLSNDGRTLEEPTMVDNYEMIRSMVLMNL